MNREMERVCDLVAEEHNKLRKHFHDFMEMFFENWPEIVTIDFRVRVYIESHGKSRKVKINGLNGLGIEVHECCERTMLTIHAMNRLLNKVVHIFDCEHEGYYRISKQHDGPPSVKPFDTKRFLI